MIQLMRSLKITPTHLERKAIIYIRQSSPKQVRLNTDVNARVIVRRNNFDPSSFALQK